MSSAGHYGCSSWKARSPRSVNRFAYYLSCVMRNLNLLFVYAKTKAQISCAVTAQLISAFVFAT